MPFGAASTSESCGKCGTRNPKRYGGQKMLLRFKGSEEVFCIMLDMVGEIPTDPRGPSSVAESPAGPDGDLLEEFMVEGVDNLPKKGTLGDD